MSRFSMNRSLAWLWTGRLVSQAGDRFYAIALAWWILQETRSGLAMGAFLASSSLPGILAGPLLGPLLDRARPRRTLIGADLARGLIVGLVAYRSWTGRLDLGLVCAAAALLSLASAVFDPLSQAVLPRMVAAEDVPEANARLQAGSGLCMVLGPALGAGCLAVLGFTGTFLLNAVSFVLCAACVARIELRPRGEAPARAPYLSELGAGLAFVWNSGTLRAVIATVGVAHFFTGALMLALPFLASSLPGGVKALGAMEMSVGLGFVLGSFLRLGREDAGTRAAGLFGFLAAAGGCMILLGLLQRRAPVPAFLVLLALYGFAVVQASIRWQTLLQLSSPEHMAGRVFSLSSLAGNIAMPLAYGCVGAVLTPANLPGILLACGGCLAATGWLGAGRRSC